MNGIIPLLILGIVAGVAFLRPHVGLYVIVFLTPIQYYFVTTSEATLIRYIGWIVFIAWIAQKFLTRSRFTPLSSMRLLLPIFLFLYFCLISFAWSFDTTWQTSIFSYIQLVIWVILILDLIDSQQRLGTLLTYLSLGVLISALILINEFLTKPATWEFSTIAEGGFGDRNTSAASYLYVLPFFFLLLQYKSGIRQIVAVIAIAVLVTAVGISASRTSLLILPLVLLLMSALAPGMDKKLKYLLLVVVILAVTLPFWPWEQLEYRYSNVWSGGQDQDLGGRVRTWNKALNEIAQEPLTGRGLGIYRDKYPVAAHNLFLEVASQLGVLSLLLLTWIWAASWQHLKEAKSQAKDTQKDNWVALISAIQISFIVYLFVSLTLSTETHRMLWLTFALAGVCHNISRNSQSVSQVSTRKHENSQLQNMRIAQ